MPMGEQGRSNSERPSFHRSVSKSSGLKRHSSNSFEHFFTGIRLLEVSRAAHSFRGGARFRIVVSRDKDDGSMPAFGREALCQLNTGHGTELDVEYKAAELGVLRVREE